MVMKVRLTGGVCFLQRSYREAIGGMQEGAQAKDRDDRVHGSLLIINELIVNSAWPDEVSCRHGDATPLMALVLSLLPLPYLAVDKGGGY